MIAFLDKSSSSETAALRSELRKIGIGENRTYVFADDAERSGTVGAGLKGIEFYRLNKQPPDYMAFDNQRRLYITDYSVTAPWRDLYDKNIVFARAA